MTPHVCPLVDSVDWLVGWSVTISYKLVIIFYADDNDNAKMTCICGSCFNHLVN